MRSEDQSLWRHQASGYSRRQIFEQTDHPLELARVELPAGARVGFPATAYARIRQVVWMLEGLPGCRRGRRPHELAPADCLAFGAPADTAFLNESATACAYLV